MKKVIYSYVAIASYLPYIKYGHQLASYSYLASYIEVLHSQTSFFCFCHWVGKNGSGEHSIAFCSEYSQIMGILLHSFCLVLKDRHYTY